MRKYFARYIFVLFILCFIPFKGSFQNIDLSVDTKKNTIWELFTYDVGNMWGGIKHVYTQPFKWQKDDLLVLGGVTAGTALLYVYDQQTSNYFIEQGETTPKLIRDFGWYFGNPQNNYAFSAGVYGIGLFTKNEKIRKTGVLLISSATAAGFLQSLTKTVVGRARPNSGRGKGTFNFFSNKPGDHSFPSGHSVLSFVTAHAIAKQFDNLWIKGGIYAVGLISPISRLWDGAHWLTDIVIGVALSIAIVDSVDNYLTKNGKYTDVPVKKPNKISWNVQLGYGKIGFVGTF